MLALLCRSSSELILFVVCVYPGFCSCLWHSRHPGLCRSIVLTGLIYVFPVNIFYYFDAVALTNNYLKISRAFPILKTSAKSVQTTRVVCTNFSRSLYRLQLKFADRYAQAQIYVRIPSKISTTYSRK